MLGHVLRGPENGPAYQSLVFAVNTLNLTGRRGRPQSNLFTLITNDLNKHDLRLKCIEDLENLRSLAHDRSRWRQMQVNVCNNNSSF